jgi:ABC-type glutathione transport system ATPase component
MAAPTSEPPPPPTEESLRELLHDPRVCEALVAVLLEELEAQRQPSMWRRLQPWIAGASSALVTLLAFFLPSLQEQWERLQSRTVVQRYVELGRDFMEAGRYRLAEETFGKAFELSENRRLDIDELRLEARVGLMNADPGWGRRNPEGLHESDFLYLLQIQKRGGRTHERAATLASYARPTVLMLDEATANLDFKTEEAVKQALEIIARGRTTLVVAHRRSMLTTVDRVLVLRGGRIEQDGTPEALAAVEGYFHQMMEAPEAHARRP